MSNRQARREQARQPRTTRPTRGAPGKTPQRKSSSRGIFTPAFLIGIGAAVLVMLGALAWVMAQSGGGDEEFVTRLEKAREDFPAELANGLKLGNDNAPVKLTEFEDFQCPFCLQYTALQEPTLIEEFVKTGILQIEFRQLPILGRGESVQAAMAGICAGDQNKFWQFKEEIFLVQARAGHWSNERIDVGRLSNAKLKEYASKAGLDRAQFDDCLDSAKHLERVNEDQRTAREFGLAGTPGFLVNETALGNGTPTELDDWRKLINDVAAAVQATPSATASATATASASPSATNVATTGTATPAPAASATPTATAAR